MNNKLLISAFGDIRNYSFLYFCLFLPFGNCRKIHFSTISKAEIVEKCIFLQFLTQKLSIVAWFLNQKQSKIDNFYPKQSKK